ncbi:MAG: efflux RND transporter periplasmic adaptor subunit [Megasphaera sp.]|jgi:membrane fusion protein (multidrug efflux system)|nr:efflux RND transporter periplasmic adaptor subunit [Megasphaera sp.]
MCRLKKLYGKIGKRWLAVGLAIGFMVISTILLHYGGGKAVQASDNTNVSVQAMKIVQQDAAVTYEYVGQVKARNEVKMMSKVSGNVIQKMVNGGEYVSKGQPLFQIDNRQYDAAIKAAEATLNKSQSTLRSSQRTADRYSSLSKLDAVAQETTDSYVSQAEEDAATVETNQASLQEARDNERDTLICSPIDGRIDVNDVSTGYYVVAGSTTMGTISSVDPVWVQFTMSESEYLDFLVMGQNQLPEFFKNHLQITLSNGGTYPIEGRVEQVDKGINETTGTITLKAVFDNPNHMLTPGMFANIKVHGEVQKNVLMVPQKAVKDLLNKSIVYVLDGTNKAVGRQVTLGSKIGNMVIVKDGLDADDTIVVEGIDKIKKDSTLSVTMIDAAEIMSTNDETDSSDAN